MPEISPRRLGRIPSPPDARDFRLENFVGLGTGSGDPVTLAQKAEAELKLTTITYRQWAAKRYPDPTVTHWWKALDALHSIIGPPTGQVWMDPQAVLDQGNYGTCVGNGWAQWGNTLPVGDTFDETVARSIYREATILDGADDPTYQTGATVRSGAKAMQNRKRLQTYAFASSLASVDYWLQTQGPVVIGSDWTVDMFDPDAAGFVTPTGATAGGHCYLLLAYDSTSYTFLNSWGDGWGLKGYFKMTRGDFAILLGRGGEACVALELAL